MGRTVKCPACSHRHQLTADMTFPDGLELHDDEPSPGSSVEPEAAPAANSTAHAAIGPVTHPYKLDLGPVEPLRGSIKPKPVASTRNDPRPRGLTLTVPVLAGGAVGVALLSGLLVWAAVGLIGVRAPSVKIAAASGGASAPAPPAPQPDAPLVANLPTPRSVTTFDDLGRARVVTQPAVEGESEVAAKARLGAATVATRDDGSGKTLSTADIVAESEPSVALIKGKSSSGTGFLVAPGLLATNAHVVEDELVTDLEVRFVSADARHNVPLKAELLYEDRDRDLAFLAVETDLKPLRVARTYVFRKGEDITVIGNPGIGDGKVLENAISRGVMSTKTQIENRNFYQLGIAINPGNSGGPVFDSSGRVIGVATLKSSKQEATGFSVPIEDVQEALAKLAIQQPSFGDRTRSQHRLKSAVKGLGSGAALMCLVIDLRHVAASNNAEVKALLGKLEPVAAEMEKEAFPSLTAQPALIANDPLIDGQVKNQIGRMAESFANIREMYAGRVAFDNNQLRGWKQTHKQLFTDLSGALKLEVPEGLMVAFDDHGQSQATILTFGPQTSFGMYGPRFSPRAGSGMPGMPGGMARPPSLRDRMGPRRGFR